MSKSSCPKCGSIKHVIPVFYGSKGERSKKGCLEKLTYHGGDMVSLHNPQWYCKKHKIAFEEPSIGHPGSPLVESESNKDFVRAGSMLAQA